MATLRDYQTMAIEFLHGHDHGAKTFSDEDRLEITKLARKMQASGGEVVQPCGQTLTRC